ncbi:MAG: SDR family NAD(P)-dependent oxidoreductase [Acidobacteria bacterium]|nr:SDR family NAD(P)-dependent oxidoreductase [Acidobacteriota bacterium]
MTPYSFRDRVVLLTGATGGLGRELARGLASRGAVLLLTGRHADRLEALAGELCTPASATVLDAKLHEPGEAARLAEAALAVHGRVDCLINNAGLGYFATIEESLDARVRELFELNTFAPLALARALVPAMRSRGQGRIVNIVSCAGRVPIPSAGVYGASKSALAILANTMRLECKGSGIDVVIIYPGTINTAFEINALAERDRAGIDTSGHRGGAADVAIEVLDAASGPAGEVWLEPMGRKLAAEAITHPERVDEMMEPLRARVVEHDPRDSCRPRSGAGDCGSSRHRCAAGSTA